MQVKISNVKVDLCNWQTEPWKTGVGTAFGGTVQLGVVTVETDAGVSGNAFLGSSMVGAEHSVPHDPVAGDRAGYENKKMLFHPHELKYADEQLIAFSQGTEVFLDGGEQVLLKGAPVTR